MVATRRRRWGGTSSAARPGVRGRETSAFLWRICCIVGLLLLAGWVCLADTTGDVSPNFQAGSWTDGANAMDGNNGTFASTSAALSHDFYWGSLFSGVPANALINTITITANGGIMLGGSTCSGCLDISASVGGAGLTLVDTVDESVISTLPPSETMSAIWTVDDYLAQELKVELRVEVDQTSVPSSTAIIDWIRVDVDYTPGPWVTSIERQDPADDLTSADTVTFRVTFTEAMQLVGTNDFELSGTASGDIDVVNTVSSSVYDVVVTSVTGDGELDLDFVDHNDIETTGEHPLLSPVRIDSEETYTIDNTDPSVNVTAPVGGEYWAETENITWTASDTNLAATPITLYYSDDGGAGWTQFATNEANDGTYPWDTTGVGDDTDYQIRVEAADLAGNTGDDTSDADFTIDNTDPSVTLTAPVGGEYWSESQNITWTATDVNLGPTPIWIYYSDDGGTGWTQIASNEANDGVYPWDTSGVADDTDYRIRVMAEDLAENTSDDTSVADFTVDNTDPATDSMTSTTPDDTYGIGSSINVTVTFTEPVSMAAGTLDIRLDTGAIVYVLPFATSLTAETTYVVGAGESSSDLEATSVAMNDGASLRDQAGNETSSIGVPITNISTGSDIVIETDPPGVESVTAVPALVGNDHIGDKKLLLTIDFDEDMDSGIAPTITFPAEDPSTTITFDSGSWAAADIYDAYYDVADSDALVEDIDVRVTGAEDEAGNPMTQYDEADVFDIDVQDPTILSVAVDPTFFADADAGPDALEIVVIFSETMDTSQPPNFILDHPDASLTVSIGSGTWSEGTHVDDTYTVLCDITDQGDAQSDVTIDVIDTLDVNRNPQQDYTPEAEFSFDMENPTVTVDIVDDTLNDTDDRSMVTIEFSEEVAGFGFGDLSAVNGTFSTFEKIDGDSYEATFIATDGIDDVGSVSVGDGSYTDVAGNLGSEGSDTVDIDRENPTVTGLFVDTDPVWDGDLTQQVTIDYSEPMDTAVDPTVAITGITTEKTDLGNGSWDGDSRYEVTITLDDDDEEDATIDVTVSGARDASGELAGVDGNLQVPYTASNPFEVDTLNPTIASITSITPDGFYNSGTVDVTVTFSEQVTLAGGTLDVTLDTPSDVVSFAAFSHWPDASTNYTIGAGDNSCDLDATGITLTGATLQDDAGNDAVVSLPATTIADGSDIVVDTSDPAITWISEFPAGTQAMDGDCSLTFPINVRITDNCGILVDDVSFNLFDGGTVSMTDTLSKAQVSDTRVDITGNVTLTNSSGGPASATLDLSATDRAGNMSGDTDTVTVDDTTAPTISGFNLPDGTLYVSADTCEYTVNYSATLNDNCCLDEGNVTVDVEFVDPYNTATLDAPAATISNAGGTPNKQVGVSGSFTVSALTDDPIHVRVRINATDCNGNAMTEASDTAIFEDGAAPTISWTTELPASPQYVSSDTCSITLPILATVADACCINAANVTTTIQVTNATLSHTVTETQNGQDEVIVAGNITVSDLTGCPAVLTVRINATDCAGNPAAQLSDAVDIEDQTIPVIHDLVVEQHIVVSDCCEADIDFAAYVTDQCCITPAGITIIPTNVDAAGQPAETLTIDFDQARDVTITQNGQGRVDITGVVPIRCVTSCPAIVRVRIEATDCCGNDASPVQSTVNDGMTGHVYDETSPIARPDPRQDMGGLDESAVLDGSLVEVRLDEFGTYRLIFRESSPERIDVLVNDADNCSCEDCTHPFDPCGPCGDCNGCCGELTIDAIVDAPDYGTATIEDAVGNCQGGSVIRYAPDNGYLGPDFFTYRIRDACGNVSDPVTVHIQMVEETVMEDVAVIACSEEPTTFEVTAADLWVDRDPAQIPFEFSIVAGPSHGILVGDPSMISLTPPSLGPDPTSGALVPTLDFTEVASIALDYISAASYIGRDSVIVRFDDPFGAFATAEVDIRVIDCGSRAGGVRKINIEQGELLPIVGPLTFERIALLSPGAVMLTARSDGMEHPAAITYAWSDELGRHVLLVDTTDLPFGEYWLTIPLGNGQSVPLILGVEEAV